MVASHCQKWQLLAWCDGPSLCSSSTLPLNTGLTQTFATLMLSPVFASRAMHHLQRTKLSIMSARTLFATICLLVFATKWNTTVSLRMCYCAFAQVSGPTARSAKSLSSAYAKPLKRRTDICFLVLGFMCRFACEETYLTLRTSFTLANSRLQDVCEPVSGDQDWNRTYNDRFKTVASALSCGLAWARMLRRGPPRVHSTHSCWLVSHPRHRKCARSCRLGIRLDWGLTQTIAYLGCCHRRTKWVVQPLWCA